MSTAEGRKTLSRRKTMTSKGGKPKPPKVAADEIVKDCVKSGKLNKCGGKRKTWHTRFCVLHKGKLYYYAKQKDKEPKGVIDIVGVDIEPDTTCGKEFAFRMIATYRTYYACCESQDDLYQWIEALQGESRRIGYRSLVVDNSAHGDVLFKTIEEAVEVAKDGDKIFIRQGEYRTHLDIKKSIELSAAYEWDLTTLKSEPGKPLIVFRGGQGKISHLTLRQEAKDPSSSSSSTNCDCVEVRSGSLDMINCELVSNTGNGISVSGDAELKIQSSLIHGCRANGICFSNNSKGRVESSQIFENEGDGIRILDNAGPEIKANRIFEGKAYGIHVNTRIKIRIDGNEIKNNMKEAIKVEEGCDAECSNNII